MLFLTNDNNMSIVLKYKNLHFKIILLLTINTMLNAHKYEHELIYLEFRSKFIKTNYDFFI